MAEEIWTAGAEGASSSSSFSGEHKNIVNVGVEKEIAFLAYFQNYITRIFWISIAKYDEVILNYIKRSYLVRLTWNIY